MDIGWQLRALVGSLAREEGVFGSAVPETDGAVEEQVRRLVVEAERAWELYAAPGASGPDSSAQVADALMEVDLERGVDLMTYLAAGDLVMPCRLRREREPARRAVGRIVQLLGYGSTWLTNINELSAGVRAWNPVTRHTFDGVVAGVGNGFLVVLLQVGEG